MTEVLWLIIAFPLAGSILLHFLGRRIGDPLSGWIASAAIGASFVVAAAASIPFIQGGAHAEHLMLWEWMPALGAALEVEWDPRAALRTFVVTGGGVLVHVFAIG